MKRSLSVALAVSVLCNAGLLAQQRKLARMDRGTRTFPQDLGLSESPRLERHLLPTQEAGQLQESLQKASETETVLLAEILKLQDQVAVLRAFNEADRWPRFPPWLILDEESLRKLDLNHEFVEACSRAGYAKARNEATAALETVAKELGLTPDESSSFVRGALQAAVTLRRINGETERDYDHKRSLIDQRIQSRGSTRDEDVVAITSHADERLKALNQNLRSVAGALLEKIPGRRARTAALREILPEVLLGLSITLQN
jgi:hypothetical protein